MSRHDEYDALMWAMATGAAVTPEQVDVARRGHVDLSELADEVRAGASASLPSAPTAWRSAAGSAYAAALDDARSRLVSASAIVADAAQGLAAKARELEVRLDEQRAILAAGPRA